MIVGGYELDKLQNEAVYESCKYVLLIAGAGCGKTTTIIGKIKYLVLEKNIDPKKILCISFTNASVEDVILKLQNEKIIGVDVYTFHKLALKILDDANQKYKITNPDTLNYIIDEFFESMVLTNKNYLYIILKHFKYIVFKINLKKQYLTLNKYSISKLKKMIYKYITYMKINGYDIKFFKKNYPHKIKFKSYYFLKLVLIIYQIYENELSSNLELDFDDMIKKAIENIDKTNLDYEYIFIDEFQDTSFIRFKLIRSLLSKCDSNLFVVGDDFQSIYRFAGCDLNIMLDFKKYFPQHKILKITKTYRNSQTLLDIAGRFILKNPSQIKKELVSNKKLDDPVVIVKYKNSLELKKLLYKLNGEVLILMRNNKDIYKFIDDDFTILGSNLKLKNSDLKITYMTIHKSKGLEAENVIIVNLEDSVTGFPSKLVDDKIFNPVIPKKDKYLYAEERRLFYVALTRTKNHVYLFVPYKNPSVFYKEILNIVKACKKAKIK